MNTPPNEIVISTSSKELADELVAVKIDGANQFEAIRKRFDAIKLYHVAVQFVQPVAIGLFTNWLYDAIKKRSNSKTEIEGKAIQQIVTQVELNVVVNQVIQQINIQAPHDRVMENHNLCEAVQEIPPGAARRCWTLRADYRCAGGSHHHAIVHLSECPLYLEVNWKRARNG